MIEIVVTGSIPSKKNQLAPRKDGKGYYNPKGRLLKSIVAQIQWQTGNMEPIDCAAIDIELTCSKANGDLDGKVTTLIDAMVEAGILINDNLKHLPGPVYFVGKKGTYDEARIVLGKFNDGAIE